ncbi:MAG: hypothetical protein HY052_09605, partial [Proteobacteria bacterium]|nr:hypothetical protein [Pseudomonadota bacterium]
MPPRLAGPVSGWSGLDAADHQSWMLNHVADLGFNALWFSPMCETTKVEKTAHGKKLTGSYYAIRDHFKLDQEFTSGNGARDREHLKHFCAAAAKKGIRVYADLVFNHVAADHPLVEEETAAIKSILLKDGDTVRPIIGEKDHLIGFSYKEGEVDKEFYFKFCRKDDFSLQVGGPPEDPWSDVAQISYFSPEARRFFIAGDKEHQAYFKRVLDFYIDCGFSGFRCDVAYRLPPDVWQELITYTREQQPDSIFLAETLGGPAERVDALAAATVVDKNGAPRPAFDLGMLGFYWWNLKDK